MNTPRTVLKAADVAAMEAEHSVHPLNENAVRLKRSLGDATGLTQLCFHLTTLMPPDKNPPNTNGIPTRTNVSISFEEPARQSSMATPMRSARATSWDSRAATPRTRC
ncbi:hypothetical protein [Burkholderia lata]|uniref:hypothetical protein n=1 Tax=Burkholderia lata (strain ATCC 17760 / DSM 23089 / LMG 22485 / NCIMB 9086 / R18194 / 383) TaxID=482957 RepID=UPI0014547EFB|nr:cupin [Burkholderia lata]